jgi:hypothetical protein
MKSPFTGGEMTLHTETRKMYYRQQEFEVQFQYYKCMDTGEQFTDGELDDVNCGQVYGEYEVRMNGRR